jgi:hypothetical protein
MRPLHRTIFLPGLRGQFISCRHSYYHFNLIALYPLIQVSHIKEFPPDTLQSHDTAISMLLNGTVAAWQGQYIRNALFFQIHSGRRS